MEKARIIFLLAVVGAFNVRAQNVLPQDQIQSFPDTLIFDFNETADINLDILGEFDSGFTYTMPIYVPNSYLPMKIAIVDSTSDYHLLVKPLPKRAESVFPRSEEGY